MRFVHCTKEAFLERNAGKKIICFGASRMPYEAAHEMPIADSIECVLDNDPKKIDSKICLEEKSIPVFGPEWLKGRELDNHVILITSRFYHTIFQQLKDMPELDGLDCHAWPCLYLDDESTPEKKYQSRIVNMSMAFYSSFLHGCALSPQEEAERLASFRQSLSTFAGGLNVLPSVVLLHSNICSLQCEHCCDLIPRVKTPYHISPEEAADDLENLLRGLDMCVQVDLTDGEVFLYPELAELIERVAAFPKVLTVTMTTNATVMPSEPVLRALQNPKVSVSISDYGFIDKLGALIRRFEKLGIRFGVFSGLRWKEVGLPQKRAESKEWLYYEFLRCQNKICSKPLLRGRLYGCMPAFRFADTGFFSCSKDYVDLLQSDADEEIGQKITSLCMTDFIEACTWCRLCDQTVPDAIPSGKERSAYTIIKKDKLGQLINALPGREQGTFR